VRSLVAVCVVAGAVWAKPVETYVVTAPTIEILDPSGSVQRGNVEQALAAVQSDLVACRATGWNSDALAWVVIDWHGKVTRTEIAVAKPDAERCIGKALDRLVVPAAQARATFVVRLRPEREVVTDIKDLGSAGSGKTPPASASVHVDLGPITVGAEFADPERVRTIVRRHAETLKGCYAVGVDHGAGSTNHVTLKLAIATTGAVVGAQVAATSSPREMVDCYRREAAKFSFPPPSKAATVEIEQRPGLAF